MKLRKNGIFFLLIEIAGLVVSAQNRIWDVGSRFSFISQYNITSKQYLLTRWRIQVAENFTELTTYRGDIGYGIKILPSLRILARYSFINKMTGENYYRGIHRYSMQLNYNYFFNKYFTLHSRTILQYSTHLFITDIQDNGYEPYYRTDIRERAGLSYNLSSTSNIYLQDEVLYTLSNYPVELRRNRIYVGYEKKINDKWLTRLYFILQSSFHKKNTPNYHYFIFGWDWEFDWN